MELKPLDLNFLSRPDVGFYGCDSYGNSVYVYHGIALVNMNGELIPYTYDDDDED